MKFWSVKSFSIARSIGRRDRYRPGKALVARHQTSMPKCRPVSKTENAITARLFRNSLEEGHTHLAFKMVRREDNRNTQGIRPA